MDTNKFISQEELNDILDLSNFDSKDFSDSEDGLQAPCIPSDFQESGMLSYYSALCKTICRPKKVTLDTFKMMIHKAYVNQLT